MERIITIGREFGSGGREIGIKLAEKLGIPFYDKELISLAAEAGGLDHAFVEQNEEGAGRIGKKPFRMSFASFNYRPSFSDSIFLHQCSAIKSLAEKGPCVIVGRCADYVLRDDNIVSVFIAASMPFKIARKRAMAPEKASYTDQQMERYIDDVNKARCKYYEHYSGQRWGNIADYHLCIHSDMVGVDGAVDVILAYIRAADDNRQ